MSIRKLIGTIFLLSLIIPLAASAKGIVVKGSFKNVGSAKYAYLYEFVGPELIKKDSAELKQGNFEFKFKNDPARGLYKIGSSEEQSVLLILGKESLNLTANLEDLPRSVKITGSKENDIFYEYRDFNDRYNLQVQALQRDAQILNGQRANDNGKYEYEMSKLQLRLDSLNQDQKNAYVRLANQDKNLFISKIIGLFVFNHNDTQESFLKSIDFNDPEMARGDMIFSKASNYLQRFAQPNIESWKESFNYMLSVAPPKSPGREALYLSLIKLVLPYDSEFARKLAENYAGEYSSSAIGKKYLVTIPKGRPEVGDQAPDITLNDPNGKPVKLSSLKGKVVLLDFWASWCGPCRMENPNVVKAYHKYKDKGFTVFSVSLDNDKDKWQSAIQKDGLEWNNHVSDLQGWKSPIVQLYQVKGIPATFLIGKDGKIIGANLRGASLEEKLEEVCK